MNQISVKIKRLNDKIPLPAYQTSGSAAFDLHAAIDLDLYIGPGERKLVPTGIAIAPNTSDVVAIVCARSGLGAKRGITLSNGIGVIDSDYRGEIMVSLHNISAEPYVVAPFERIAQMMFLPVFCANLIPVEELEETERGAGGFGSTGKA